MINFKRTGLADFSQTIIMAILNATDDSFYSESRLSSDRDLILRKAEKAIADGALILDIGGYSTRPSASEVSLQQEIDRVCFAAETIRSEFPQVLISIDTFRAKVAEKAVLESGADMINDVSAGRFDPELLPTVVRLRVPYVLMHSEGATPQQQHAPHHYENFLDDLFRFFSAKLSQLYYLGISDVILDPGFGFSKTLDQNYQLLNHLHEFRNFPNCHLLVGLSRKRMAYEVAETTPENSLPATSALHSLALMQTHVSILRVHDVAAAKQTIRIAEMLKQNR